MCVAPGESLHKSTFVPASVPLVQTSVVVVVVVCGSKSHVVIGDPDRGVGVFLVVKPRARRPTPSTQISGLSRWRSHQRGWEFWCVVFV